MAETKDFLHAKSMLTPGIAGAIAMLITNTLHAQFELPHRWVALVLSFGLGALVFGDRETGPWKRGLFYVVNSLIIFSMAIGTNVGAQVVTAPPPSDDVLESAPAEEGFFQDWFGPEG